ncbi:hypothetical protein H9P43_003966 [Blastocladiella emersonii ATCC 22665]|nr:hypothetical protein H9P43_003966 [Blastocladiella emersonii ATCC 22665]
MSCYTWYFITAGATDLATLKASTAVTSTTPRLNVFPVSAPTVLGKLWIRSRSTTTSDDNERAGTALVPSSPSKQITNLFHQLGEEPTLSLASTGATTTINSMTYSKDGSYWIVNMTSTRSASVVLQVESSQVAVMGCAVAQTIFPLSVSTSEGVKSASPSPSLLLTALAQSSLSGLGDVTRIVQDSCALNEVFLRFGTGTAASAILYSDTTLTTTPTLITPTASSVGAMGTMVSVPVGAFALTTSGSLLLPNGTLWSPLTSRLPPSVTLDRAVAASSCDVIGGHGISRLSNLVALWSSATANAGYLVTVAPSVTSLTPQFTSSSKYLAEPLYVPVKPNHAQWDWGYNTVLDAAVVKLDGIARVHDVEIDHGTQQVLALVRTTAGVDQLIAIPDPQSLSPGATVSPTVLGAFPVSGGLVTPLDSRTKSPALQLIFGRAMARDLFMFGDTLLYSGDGGATQFEVSLVTRNPTLTSAGRSRLGASETVVQVVTVPIPVGVSSPPGTGALDFPSPAVPASMLPGRFAVLTSENRVFVGLAGQQEALEIYNGALISSGAYKLMFRIDGSLVAVQATSAAPFFQQINLPVPDDFSVAQWNVAGLTCPYLAMSTTLLDEYYVDIGTAASFQSKLVVDSSQQAVPPVVTSGNASIVGIAVTARAEAYSLDTRVITTNTTLAPASATLPGAAAALAYPQVVNLACPPTLAPRSSAMVRAMCPPSRRIVARYATPSVAAPVVVNCTAGATTGQAAYTVTVGAGKWTDWDSGNAGAAARSMAYNCTRFGNPLSAYYGQTWQPVLDLYDGPNFVRQVQGDFALIEILGRNTFSYNTTADDVLCTSPPQSAASMLRNGGTWNKDNYISCTDIDLGMSKADGSHFPYEIFNATNGNRIQWGSNEDAVYLFRAVVLDASESYCYLTTDFAVAVYGAPLTAGTQVGIVLGFIFAVLAALGASYWWYRQSKAKEKTD